MIQAKQCPFLRVLTLSYAKNYAAVKIRFGPNDSGIFRRSSGPDKRPIYYESEGRDRSVTGPMQSRDLFCFVKSNHFEASLQREVRDPTAKTEKLTKTEKMTPA